MIKTKFLLTQAYMVLVYFGFITYALWFYCSHRLFEIIILVNCFRLVKHAHLTQIVLLSCTLSNDIWFILYYILFFIWELIIM